MLRPSYSDLLEVLNKEANQDNTIGSRYTIVIAAAKRARQLVDHAKPLIKNVKIDKPVSIAVQELYEGKIKVTQNFAATLAEEERYSLESKEKEEYSMEYLANEDE